MLTRRRRRGRRRRRRRNKHTLGKLNSSNDEPSKMPQGSKEKPDDVGPKKGFGTWDVLASLLEVLAREEEDLDAGIADEEGTLDDQPGSHLGDAGNVGGATKAVEIMVVHADQQPDDAGRQGDGDDQ